MHRISTFIILALLAPACDGETVEAMDSVKINRTAEEAVITSENGDLLWSVPPDDLVMDVVEERKLAQQKCYDCDECHEVDGGAVICTGCVPVSCV